MRRPDTTSRQARRRRDDGQSIVEAAIIMPTMIFIILGIMQLTMVQHARIMLEYAAFCAARAGIVYNASVPAMTRAAELALMPTMGRADQPTYWTEQAVSGVLSNERSGRQPFQIPIVSVTVLNPTSATSSNLSSVTGQTLNKEVDFDDIRDVAAQANILQIKLNYYYHMKIPFVNQLLQTLFFAQVGNIAAVWRVQNGLEASDTLFANGIDQASARGGFQTAGVGLTPLAGNIVNAAHANRFYFPLQTTYSMRMQSNVYLSNLGGG